MNDLSETESREYVPLRVALSLYCAILVLAVFPFTNNPTGDVKYLVTAWAAGLLVFFLSWSIWRGKVLRAGDGILLPLVAALAVVYVASLAQSLNVSWSLLVVCRLLAVALLCWVASRVIRTVAGAIALTKWFCIAVAVASLYGFLQRAGWDPLPWDESHKMLEEYKNMPATFGNPNLAGHVLVMATILSVAVGSLTGHRWLMLLAPLFVAHLLITQHRAGLIALASGAALYMAATLATRGLQRTPSASLFRTIALFSLFVGAGLVAGVAVMLARNGTLYPNDLSAFMRMNSVLSAAQMIVSRPILGFGAGMYPIENARYWTPFEQDWYAVERRLNTHAHSDVLETGVEAGLFGAGLHLAIALCAIGWCLYAFYTRERQEDRRLAIGMAAMFTAFAVDGIAGFPFRAPVSSGLYFVLIGVAHGVFATRTVSTGKPRSNARKLAPLLVLFALCAAIYMETRSFASQYLLLRGRGAAYWQEFAEAERVLGQADRFAPWNWEIPYERGMAQYRAEKRGEAMKSFETALARNPGFIQARVSLSSMLVETVALLPANETATPYLDSAAAHIGAALALCPRLPEANEIAGRIALYRADTAEQTDRMARLTEAAEALRLSVAYSDRPKSSTYALLARALDEAGKTDEAEIVMRRAVDIAPERRDSWEAFEQFALESGRTDGLLFALHAHAEQMKSLIANTNEQMYRTRLALLYAGFGNAYATRADSTDTAERYYRMAVNLAPVQPETWVAFAKFATEQDRLPLLSLCIDTTIAQLTKTKVEVPAALRAAASALVGQIDSAISMLDATEQRGAAGVAVDPRTKWAAELIRARSDAGTVRIDENQCAALARVFAVLGDAQSATELYGDCFGKLSSEGQRKHFQTYHEALMVSKDNTKLVALLRTMSDKYPTDVPLKAALARSLAASGSRKEAEWEYQLLLMLPMDAATRSTFEAELAALKATAP